jgi:hypothetical protein
MNNGPDSESASRAIVNMPPPKKGSPYACASVSTDRFIAGDGALGSKPPVQKQALKYLRSLALTPKSGNEIFGLVDLNFGAISIGDSCFTIPSFEPVVVPRIPVPLSFEPVEQTATSDSTACTQSTFMTGPPQIQNFYNSYAVAKPYVRKSEAPAYYSKPGNRSDISLGIKQRQQFFGKS